MIIFYSLYYRGDLTIISPTILKFKPNHDFQTQTLNFTPPAI